MSLLENISIVFVADVQGPYLAILVPLISISDYISIISDYISYLGTIRYYGPLLHRLVF